MNYFFSLLACGFDPDDEYKRHFRLHVEYQRQLEVLRLRGEAFGFSAEEARREVAWHADHMRELRRSGVRLCVEGRS